VASLQAELKASEKLVAELRSQMAIVKSEVGGGSSGSGSGLAGWDDARHVVQCLSQMVGPCGHAACHAGGMACCLHTSCAVPCTCGHQLLHGSITFRCSHTTHTLGCSTISHTNTAAAASAGTALLTPCPPHLPQALASQAVATDKGSKVLVAELEDVDAKAMQEAAVKLQAALGDSGAVVLGTKAGDKVNFVAAFGPAVVKAGQQAGKVVGAVAKVCGGGGGGKPQLAQAGGKDATKFEEALEVARKTLMEAL
jgi:hypothetical protein